MIYQHADFDQHEQVIFCNDPAIGLRAIIAIHSTALGPAAGGCRMHPYANEEDALTDVLRLSKGMSYKNAEVVRLDFGNDVVDVDGRSNFAESSNVILKNSAYLGMLLAACENDSLFHPKFLLMDNIEDKGMEPERSQNFQKLIHKRFSIVRSPFQIIFTTSMMNPDLENYTVGPNYTHEQRTLLGNT